jgi:hypothetical protein
MLYRTIRNIKMTRGSRAYEKDPDVRGLAGGLWVSVAAYMISAFFASTEYSMYPYFLVAYTTALYQIVTSQEPVATENAAGAVDERRYARRKPRELVWTR